MHTHIIITYTAEISVKVIRSYDVNFRSFFSRSTAKNSKKRSANFSPRIIHTRAQNNDNQDAFCFLIDIDEIQKIIFSQSNLCFDREKSVFLTETAAEESGFSTAI